MAAVASLRATESQCSEGAGSRCSEGEGGVRGGRRKRTGNSSFGNFGRFCEIFGTRQEARPNPNNSRREGPTSGSHTAHEASNPIRKKNLAISPTLPRWHPPPPPAAPPAAGAAAPTARPLARRRIPRRAATVVSPRAFGGADFDGFVRRAWRGANAGAERFAFEARQAAQRLDGRFSISRRLAEASRAARERAVEIDAELGIGRRWRTFSVDFSRNWPRYRREINDFMETPIGRAFATLFFLWLALSGWLFRIFIFGTFVLPFAAPLLLGTLANRVAIEGTCPACKRRFVGYRNQVIRCMNCQNIVWQPNSSSSGGARSSRSSEPDVIDVEYEEK